MQQGLDSEDHCKRQTPPQPCELKECSVFGNRTNKMLVALRRFFKAFDDTRRFYTWVGGVYNGFQVVSG